MGLAFQHASGLPLGAAVAASEKPQRKENLNEEKIMVQFPSYHRLRKKVCASLCKDCEETKGPVVQVAVKSPRESPGRHLMSIRSRL